MTPLKNVRHEAFAQARARNLTADASYQVAGYKPDRSHAAKLATKRHIVARVQELQRAAATATVLSISEKREFIARVVRSAPQAASMDNADCELAMTKMGPVALFPSKAALIKLDNDLAPDVESTAGATVIVRIGGQDDVAQR